MNNIQQLLHQLCPNGVDYKRLGEVFIQFNGMTGAKYKWKENGNCVFIDYLNVYNNLKIDVTKLCNATVQNHNQETLKKGDILFTSASETPDECALSSVIEDDIKEGVFMDDHLFGLRIKEEYDNCCITGYWKYAFRSPEFRKEVSRVVRGVTRFYISKRDFMNLFIPLPPLPVQRAIAAVLDRFTQLETELETELQCRKKQYEYYRDSLLNFDNDNVQWVKLGDIGTFYGGLSGKSKKDFNDKGNAKYITYMNVYKNAAVNLDVAERVNVAKEEHQHVVEYGDILFTGSSETPEECGFSSVVTTQLDEEVYYLNSFCFGFRLNDATIYIPDFLKHLFRGNALRKAINKTASGVTRYNVSKARFAKLLIPLPPLSVQRRIVGILDRFEALTTSISEGLPAEIDARRRQYEYYRDRLLTFKRKEQ